MCVCVCVCVHVCEYVGVRACRLHLDIDDWEMMLARIEGRARLNTRESPHYYGGVPDDYTVVMTNVASRTRFIGCISDVSVNDM